MTNTKQAHYYHYLTCIMNSTKQAPLLLSLLNMHYDQQNKHLFYYHYLTCIMTNTKQASLLLSLLNMHYDQHKTSTSIIIIT